MAERALTLQETLRLRDALSRQLGEPPMSPAAREKALQLDAERAGELREREIIDPAGRRITRFYGPPGSVWDSFKQQPRSVTRLRTNLNRP